MRTRLRVISYFSFLLVVPSIFLAMTGCKAASVGGGSTTPTPPTGISATAGDTQVTISWSPVAGATSYNLYWSTTSGVTVANGAKISGVSSPYVHTSLTDGTTYYYVLTTVNANGESAASTQVNATPLAPAKHIVTYKNNGAISGNPPTDSNTYQQGATVTVLGNTNGMVNTGFAFAGWNTMADGSGSSYATGATFSMGTANVDMYPVWIPNNLHFSSSGTSIAITGYTTVSGSLTIPGGVTSIADSAFNGCTGLTSITFPSSVTSIGQWAFESSGLTSVAIPSGVTSISLAAFAMCSSLTSVTIPSGVTSIGQDAFGTDVLLGPSVTIPASVTTIGIYAFYDNYDLANVYVQATTPPALPSGSMAFYGVSLQIHVPSGTVGTYKAATGWSDYATEIVSP